MARGHKQGTVYKYRNGYAAQISLPGGKRKTFYGKDQNEAFRKLTAALAAQHTGRLSADPSQTVKAYLNGWLEIVRSSVRPSTYASYDLNVRRVLPYIGNLKLDALKPPHVQNCYVELEAKGLSPRSIQMAHVVLKMALSKAADLDLIHRNVCDVATPPRVRKQEMRTLSPAQVQDLFEITRGDRFHTFWVVLATTGLRLGEALALKWEDYDPIARTLVVRRSLQRVRSGGGLIFVEPKSATSRRLIQLGTTACAALRTRADEQEFERKAAGEDWREQGMIFSSLVGTPLEQRRVHEHFDRALEKAGLPHVRIHDLRHTAATLMLLQGIHPRVVQEILGHSTITLTLGTYSHVLPSMHREAADKMDAVFSRPVAGADVG